MRAVDVYEDRTLFALDWNVQKDALFRVIQDADAQILDATGTPQSWEFEVRFPSHDDLSSFQEVCGTTDVSLDVLRVYNPTNPDSGPWFGLTARQRETLLLAVRSGYYDIPRRTSTIDLADQLGVSDQAVTERLRRAITTLVTHTLMGRRATGGPDAPPGAGSPAGPSPGFRSHVRLVDQAEPASRSIT